MIGLDVILGGVTGLIGNIISGVMNYKTQKLKNEHEQKMVELETTAMREEAKMKIEVTRAEIEGAVELADSKIYGVSQELGNVDQFSDKWIEKLFTVEGPIGKFFAIPAAIMIAISFGFVDWLRGFMRPAITMYLTGMTTVITWMAWDILQKHGVQTMTVAEAIGIFDQVISIVIYLTVTCVTWWFGDRRMAKFLTNMKTKKQR
jgi:hypothetical protein